jgi:acyl-coenzyme A synthetase/AMP-(fatty) acid ligase
LEAQKSLFAVTKAKALLYAKESKTSVDPIVAADSIATHVVPNEEDWLDAAPAKHFPLDLNLSFEELSMLPAFVLHTSGSTGIPKPVYIKHGWMMALDRFHLLRTKSGRAPWTNQYHPGDRLFTSMPLFHASGLSQLLPMAFYFEVILTLGPPGVPISADTFDTAFQHSKANMAILPPSILEDLASDAEQLEKLKKLDLIVTGGGPSSVHTAEALRGANVKAVSLIGATEGVMPILEGDTADFPYFPIDDELAGFDWRKVESAEEEDLYEMWIKRLPDCRHQSHFITFPEIDEYCTKDIFQKVKGRPGLWRYYARSDDVVVFSNGEKLNPIDIESAVTNHPQVKGALVVGQGHFQAALFVEPREELKDDASKKAFIEEIWPIVDKQNQITVAHGHVLKGLIRVASADKPFPRVSLQCIYFTSNDANSISGWQRHGPKGRS